MRILCTNDDGYLATGLNVLAAAARPLGQVTIVAPDREQSAASQSGQVHRGAIGLGEVRVRVEDGDARRSRATELAPEKLSRRALGPHDRCGRPLAGEQRGAVDVQEHR